jgi:hypothetical protein
MLKERLNAASVRCDLGMPDHLAVDLSHFEQALVGLSRYAADSSPV